MNFPFICRSRNRIQLFRIYFHIRSRFGVLLFWTKIEKKYEIKSYWHLIFFNERPQYWDSFLAYVAVKFNYWKFIIWKHFRGEEWWTDRLIWWREDRDRFLVQVGIKFNFSEFIFCKWKVFNFSYSGLQHFKLIIHNTIKMS